jgi:hypothetical protein
MSKNYTTITTVRQVGKCLIFSILTFPPVFLIYEISRKNPTLTFFTYFDFRVAVVILYSKMALFAILNIFDPKFEH